MTERLKELGSTLSKLRALLGDTKKDLGRIATLQSALESALNDLWNDPDLEQLSQSAPVWKEFSSLVASGRTISLAAQADQALSIALYDRHQSWVGDGGEYAKWLGRGIAILSRQADGRFAAGLQPCAELFGKALSIGFANELVECFTSTLLGNPEQSVHAFRSIYEALQVHEQRHFCRSTLNLLASKYLPPSFHQVKVHERSQQPDHRLVASAALAQLLLTFQGLDLSVEISTFLSKNGGCSLSFLRAIIAALNSSQTAELLQNFWISFADKLFIKHATLVQQGIYLQIILIAAGKLHRTNPTQLSILARSASHSSGLTARLASSSPRTRLLGMILGVSISSLVDKPDGRLQFDLEELKADEAKWFQSLTLIDDRPGEVSSIADLYHHSTLVSRQSPEIARVSMPKMTSSKPAQSTPKRSLISIVDEDDGLVPYAKPESGPEEAVDDSEEDASLVRQLKPKKIVYIRDLIAALQDSDNCERFQLGLRTSQDLIRRKADFGSEVRDRLEELGGIFVSLSDPYDAEDFEQLRLQGMIAILIADPKRMGPWYARSCFHGDHSISQRAVILSTLGLGARELGGFSRPADTQFPSQRLPAHLHRNYAEAPQLDAIASSLEQMMIAPISTRKRSRLVIKNELAGTVAESFFFPLISQWHGPRGSRAASSTKELLPIYIKTLSIVLSCAGPSTILLPQLTAEYWTFLLSLRSTAVRNAAALEAILFGFVTILDVNHDQRRIAQEHSRELLETHEWVNMVFEQTPGGDDESERRKTLAAAVLVKTKEIVDSYHRLMMGDLVDFSVSQLA